MSTNSSKIKLKLLRLFVFCKLNYISILYQTFALAAWSTAIIFIISDSINNSLLPHNHWLRLRLFEGNHQQYLQINDSISQY